MTGTRFWGWSRYLALTIVLAGALVMLVPAANARAASSGAANSRVGDLVVFSQDFTGMSAVPRNVCLAMDSMEGATRDLTLSYDGAGHCVSLAATEGASGKLFIGGLSPSLSTAITLDMGTDTTEEDAVVNVYAGGAWLAVRLLSGTPTDSLEITSYYYSYGNPARHSATSVTRDVGPGARFKITIVSNTAEKTNLIYLNGVKKLSTPYTRYRAVNLNTAYDPFVNPFVYFDFASIRPGRTARLRLYSVEQTVPEYAYVTPISDPGMVSFGVDLHPWKTVNDGLSLLDGGTIWADVTALAGYSASELAALKALIADDGWELGIHFSARLTDLPLDNATRLMDAETAQIKSIFRTSPGSWCSLQGADNVTHARYAYTKLGMVSRNGANGSAAGLSSIGNLGDNCWTFWRTVSTAGIVIPSFSHELDVTPAIDWSISAANFRAFVSNYADNGVRVAGFREYWDTAQNSHHTTISDVVSAPGVSLSFTVRNMGGKSRLLVKAPWGGIVRDRSGHRVPFEVSGSGIVIEVEDGTYTVGAGPRAGFSADRTVAVTGQAIQFTNLSTGRSSPLACEWDFGDGSRSSLENPSHSYGSPGSFAVALRVTDSDGSTGTQTRADYIRVNEPLSVSTSPASGVTDRSATVNGYLASPGAASAVQVSFEWGPTADYGAATAPQSMTVAGDFSADLSGLTAGMTYHCRARAVGDNTSCGSEVTFTTGSFPSGPSDATPGNGPLIAGLTAAGGRPGDELTVDITGSGLGGATAVSFGAGIAVRGFRLVSDSEIAVTITIDSAAEAGKRDVAVTTPRGVAMVPGGFKVNEAGSRVHLWVYLVSVAGGLVGLGILAWFELRLRRRYRIRGNNHRRD